MENLDHLKKSAKLKLIIMCLSTLLPVILAIMLEFVFPNLNTPNSAIPDLVFARYGILVLLEAYIVMKIVNYIKILTSIDYASAEVVKKNDERNKFIKLKTESMTIKVFIYIIGVALIATAFIDRYIFYTLLGVLLAVIIIYFSVLIYYTKKY